MFLQSDLSLHHALCAVDVAQIRTLRRVKVEVLLGASESILVNNSCLCLRVSSPFAEKFCYHSVANAQESSKGLPT